jgi:glycosyltransferase involved in cell wall biosynthesis
VSDRPLRILFATPRYLPERGGTEIHTHEVAKRLAARGAEVTVASTALRTPFSRESQDGPVRIVRVRAWPPNRDYYLAPGLARVIRQNQMDVVHCQGYHTLVPPLAMLAALTARIPYVVTLHSGGHSSPLRRRLRPLQAWLLRPLLLRARRLIAVSSFEAELFARRLRVPASVFDVIPSGADLPAAPAVPDSQRPLILSIGRLERYKGHQRVIGALPEVIRACPGSRLRIVGTGPYERRLRELVDDLGLSDLVEIAPVPADRRSEMARLLQCAGVVAVLSEYESQGLAIQEALTLGRPLVVTEGTALGELERHANVRALPLHAGSDVVAAAIVELLRAAPSAPPPLPTWDDCATALLQLYEETLDGDRLHRGI